MFTTAEALAGGLTPDALAWKERRGDCTRIVRGVYGDGPDRPTRLERAVATLRRQGAVARGALAGVLLGLDGVGLDGRPIRRAVLPRERVTVVDGVPCADGLQALVDLAATLDDDRWEQALESGLRMGLTTVAAVEAALPELGRARVPGTRRIRRVLARRPEGAPPTESLLETLMVQLVRHVERLPEPTRQHHVVDAHGLFVARLDLCFPDLGLFLELDGQHHQGQPVYDASRETAVVAATGWLPGRFTWREVVHVPRATMRRVDALAVQAARIRR